MNNVTLYGRLTRDFKGGRTKDDNSYVHGTIAVNRNYKNSKGEVDADFINVTAFSKTAENLYKFFKKGSRIVIQGHIQTSTYDKDGQTIYQTEVIVDQFSFVDKKSDNEPVKETKKETKSDNDFPF